MYAVIVKIKVLIADDHPMVRRGVDLFLRLDEDLELVGEAGSGAEAISRCQELKPDVVLMDLMLPDMPGVAAIEAIKRMLPETEIVALTGVVSDTQVSAAIRAGAIGYLLKDHDAEALCRAIKAAAQGQVQLSPQAAVHLMREVRSPSLIKQLTPRETEVLRLVAAGRANKQIAHVLGLREQTVKSHVSHILDKLQADSRTQAALYAVRAGIVSHQELAEPWPESRGGPAATSALRAASPGGPSAASAPRGGPAFPLPPS